MSFNFNPAEGLVVVGCQVKGPSGNAVLRLALDTGATSTLINASLLVATGYDPGAASDRVEITTGSGVEFVPRVVIQEMMALGVTYMDFPVLSHTLPPTAGVDGLLGLDFLRDHSLSIDFRDGTITLA